MNKPNWDTYFFEQCEIIKKRSPDTSTQIGAIIVDREHRVISQGYNGYLAGLPDEKLPKERPYKYDYMVHAEQNAICFARRDLRGASIYVNGFPCNGCIKLILTCGITAINYLVTTHIHMLAQEEIRVNHMLCHMKNVTVKGFTLIEGEYRGS